jgi:hypothetical protein
MNPQLTDLLQQIIGLLPQFQQAAAGFTRALPALTQSLGGLAQVVQAFTAAQGGWQGILQRLALFGVGRAVAGAAQTFARTPVGQFAVQAVGAAGRFAGAALGGAANLSQTALAGLAAALATPLGQAGLAAAGVAAALTTLGVVTERTVRTMLESQRQLGEMSPSMALVFAQSDVRAMMRDMKAGEGQAGTAGFLANALDNLADHLQPITTLLTNMTNVIGGLLAEVLDVLVTPVSLIAETLTELAHIVAKVWEWLKAKFGLKDEKKGEPEALSEWLDQVVDDARRGRAAGRLFPG